jgi:hypothetical protein
MKNECKEFFLPHVYSSLHAILGVGALHRERSERKRRNVFIYALLYAYGKFFTD